MRVYVHAMIITENTLFITINTTRTTFCVFLHYIVGILFPTEKTGKRMCGAPDAYHFRAYECCKVHIGTVHCKHGIKMSHKDKFFFQSAENLRGIHCTRIIINKVTYFSMLFISVAEEEYTALRVFIKQYIYHLPEFLLRIDFASVGCKRRYSIPSLA